MSCHLAALNSTTTLALHKSYSPFKTHQIQFIILFFPFTYFHPPLPPNSITGTEAGLSLVSAGGSSVSLFKLKVGKEEAEKDTIHLTHSHLLVAAPES